MEKKKNADCCARLNTWCPVDYVLCHSYTANSQLKYSERVHIFENRHKFREIRTTNALPCNRVPSEQHEQRFSSHFSRISSIAMLLAARVCTHA